MEILSISRLYNELLNQYQCQDWWPADTPYEVMVGAILTQNTNWGNVEKAIRLLKSFPKNNPLDPRIMYRMDHETLAKGIQPSGFFNVKAKRLRAFLEWFAQYDFSVDALKQMEMMELRKELLSINGIGKETADSIILYALDKPIFVIDAYTRRILGRIGINVPADYDDFRFKIESDLNADDVQLYNEYHALIVTHAKEFCRKKPLCGSCFLASLCKEPIKDELNQ